MLSPGSQAPEIVTSDFMDVPFSLTSVRPQKVLLSFYRYAGCPFCQLRFMELLDRFGQDPRIQLVAVFESPAKSIRSYAGGVESPVIVLPDPEARLYKVYSVGYGMKAWFLGALSWLRFMKSIAGGNKWGPAEGRSNRLPADFLIDEDGMIQRVHYGRNMDDHMPVADIEDFLNG